MRTAPEMKEISDNVIKEQNKSSNTILEKIAVYISNIEIRIKNLENKLNYILEKLKNNNINNIKEHENTTRLD